MIADHLIHEYATTIQGALTKLGHAYVTQRGDTVQVSFKRLARGGDRYVILEVDTQRLPPRVSIPKLDTPEMLDHLSGVVGKRVKKLNTVGLTYVVVHQPPPKPKPFPSQVPLPEPPNNLVYPWPFGATREMEAVWGDLLNTGHLLIGGKPGTGKSTEIHAGLVALLRRHGPDKLQLVLVDPKTVELSGYNGLPHLAMPVATGADTAVGAVKWLVGEMERRETLFMSVGAKKLTDYNAKATEPIPLVLAIIDEVTDLVIQWGGPKSAPFLELVRVSSKARAFGIVLCLATQNPKADILDTALRENSGTRVAFQVDQAAQSRSILGRAGAETLPVGKPGRMVVVGLGAGHQVLQGFFVIDQEVADLVGQWKTQKTSILSEVETALVVYARDHLGGAFTISELYKQFKGTLSKRKLEDLAQRWETRGWLTAPADAVSSRRITAKLLELAALG